MRTRLTYSGRTIRRESSRPSILSVLHSRERKVCGPKLGTTGVLSTLREEWENGGERKRSIGRLVPPNLKSNTACSQTGVGKEQRDREADRSQRSWHRVYGGGDDLNRTGAGANTGGEKKSMQAKRRPGRWGTKEYRDRGGLSILLTW